MGLTTADLTDTRYSEADRQDFRELYARYMECDSWAKKALDNTGILITSHPGNRPYLKSCIESHKKLNMWITVAYDNYFDMSNNAPVEHYIPPRDIIDDIDLFLMPHNQTWGGVLYPYFWLLRWGVAVMNNFEYIYCTNGDCILEKPENLPMLMELLGDGDIMGCGWEETGRGGDFNTTAFIAKTDAIKAIMKHFEDHFIPFANYEKYTQDFGNCERRFAIAIEDLGLKNVIVPEQPYNTQSHKKGYGTWYKTVGLRHIHAEHGYAYKHGLLPPELEFFDGRFMNHEYGLIKQYWETKDPSILETWWPKDRPKEPDVVRLVSKDGKLKKMIVPLYPEEIDGKLVLKEESEIVPDPPPVEVVEEVPTIEEIVEEVNKEEIELEENKIIASEVEKIVRDNLDIEGEEGKELKVIIEIIRT